MIDDFMYCNELNYSRSVFLPEVKLEIMNKESIQKILGINEDKDKCIME